MRRAAALRRRGAPLEWGAAPGGQLRWDAAQGLGWVEAGPLLLAAGGVCCLGDWAKLRPKAAQAVLSAVETGYVHVDSQNVKNLTPPSFPLRCSVWTYLLWSKKNKNGINSIKPLTQTFGVPFLAADDNNSEQIIHSTLLRYMGHSSPSPIVSDDDFKEYLNLVTLKEVSISAAASQLIQKYFVASRRAQPERLPVNAVGIITSLSEAYARLTLKDEVTPDLSLSTSFSGLAIFSKYYNCDPLDLGRIASVEQLMPLYVVDSVSHIPGLSGLFVAGIFSGSLSTVSSAVNSLAAVTLEDYLKPIYRLLYKSELPERRTSLYTKILAFLYGLVCLAVAFLAQFLGGVLQASLTIFGVIGGPLLATFTLGMFVILANEVGAFVGLLFGLCISMWLGFGGPKPPLRKLPTTTDGCFEGNLTFFTTATPVTPTEPNTSSGEYFYLYSLSYLWYIVLGFLITLFIGTIVSCLYNCYAKKIETDLNPDLFSPFVRKYVKRRQRKYQVDTVMIPALRNGTDNHSSEPKLVGSPH